MSPTAQPANLKVERVPLTPKSDTQGIRVRLKVFWKTTKFWHDADISDFQKNAPSIAEQLYYEQYWDKDGKIQENRFTCEDLAIRILCKYASSKGLPVKLSTGVRTYRNVELYDAVQHDHYTSNTQGFSDMVMLTFGAPDMQRTDLNTVKLFEPEELLPGDILAQSYDKTNNVAHHIQVVTKIVPRHIYIMQGNSSAGNIWPLSAVSHLFGVNRADPQSNYYTGKPIEAGKYEKAKIGWDYQRINEGPIKKDFLKRFQFYRWNFKGFNK